MDKVINKHVDSVEELERQLDIIIEQEVSQIDIDLILAAPKEELTRVVENIRRVFLDEYADAAIELGFDFGRKIAEKIKEKEKLEVDDSKDPNLNK